MTRLSVAVIWHMHQPLYKDRLSGRYLMPWVRLHALKDYLDMVELLAEFPTMRQTFNLVPSLLEQLVDYADHDAWDRALELTVKPVAQLTSDDRAYLLERFFDLNWEHMLHPHPRYVELANKRSKLLAQMPLATAVKKLEARDWMDLTVWFNLAWFDPMWQTREPLVARLIEKGQDFDQADREQLVALQRELIRRVIPTYKRFQDRGQVELTTTPFYHPILPLLCDTDSARVARPGLPLPTRRFTHPEDAQDQLQRGIRYFREYFGSTPRGLWPSEQSVSPAMLPLVADAGISWMVSDEGILAASQGLKLTRDAEGKLLEPAPLYQPYWAESEGRRVAMVFRDIVLSDLVGFTYSRMTAEDAAADLHHRLTVIADALEASHPGEPHLVTIALDGENCWEHYANDGADFLRAFYARVAEDSRLDFTTVSAYLDAHEPRQTITKLFSGSWIGSDFTTWIGEPTKNRAWDYLGKAREVLARATAAVEAGDRVDPALTRSIEQAWEELRIAEGSDWFWWFGEGHDSGQDELFDWQFRLHLQNVYRLIGERVPDELMESVTLPAEPPAPPERAPITPSVSGAAEAPGWELAAKFDPAAAQGAMHAAARALREVRYGGDLEAFYLRFQFAPNFVPDTGTEVVLYACYPGQPRINSPINAGRTPTSQVGATAGYHFAHEVRIGFSSLAAGTKATARLSFAGECSTWIEVLTLDKAAYREALDVAIPWRVLGVAGGQRVSFVVGVVANGKLFEVLPTEQLLQLTVPAVPRRGTAPLAGADQAATPAKASAQASR